MDNKKQIKELNKLIQLCEDSAKGYRNAADLISQNDLKNLLYKIATERATYSGELQEDARQLGRKPEKLGTVTGTLHRIMTNLKAAISKLDNKAVLEECKRGEKAAIQAYENALNEDLPEFIKTRLTQQHKNILDAYNELEKLGNKLQD